MKDREATQISKQVMNDSILRVSIDERWRAKDFSYLFDSINKLYGFNHLLIEYLKRNPYGMEYPDFGLLTSPFAHLKKDSLVKRRIDFINEAHKIFNPIEPPYIEMSAKTLMVDKIKYGSKGFADFFGIAEVFKTILEYIKYFNSKKGRVVDLLIKQLEAEEKEQNVIQKKIENLEKLGVSKETILELIGMESKCIGKLKKLQDYKLITDINIDHKEID